MQIKSLTEDEIKAKTLNTAVLHYYVANTNSIYL